MVPPIDKLEMDFVFAIFPRFNMMKMLIRVVDREQLHLGTAGMFARGQTAL